MSLNTVSYINLSALAYIDFSKSLEGLTINELILRKAIPEKYLNEKPELSSLRDESNPLRSWKLINFQPNTTSGFAAAAFQNPDTKEIVFAFSRYRAKQGYLYILARCNHRCAARC